MFMVLTMMVIIWIFHFPGCLVPVLIYITPDDECPLEAGPDHVSVTGLWWPRHVTRVTNVTRSRVAMSLEFSPALPPQRDTQTHLYWDVIKENKNE